MGETILGNRIGEIPGEYSGNFAELAAQIVKNR